MNNDQARFYRGVVIDTIIEELRTKRTTSYKAGQIVWPATVISGAVPWANIGVIDKNDPEQIKRVPVYVTEDMMVEAVQRSVLGV